MEGKFTTKNKKIDIPVSVVITAMLVIMVVLTAIFILSNIHITFGQRQIATSVDTYLVCQESIKAIKDASDFLTTQVRGYVATENWDYVESYFYEANNNQSREIALKNAAAGLKKGEILSLIKDAVDTSMELMKVEIYSLKLATNANHVERSIIPRDIQNTDLIASDRALSDSNKKALASQLLYSEEYLAAKQRIISDLENANEELLNNFVAEQKSASDTLRFAVIEQRVLIGLVFVLVAVAVAFVIKMVLIPLRDSSKYIQEQSMLPLEGSKELKILAKNYNRMLMKIRTKNELLSFKADHDGLTNLLNRRVFDETITNGSEKPLALMVIDIDCFKQVNDNYGHDFGDIALKGTAEALMNGFRTDDLICRIGGDEFAVFLFGVIDEQKEMIVHKIEMITDHLKSKPELKQLITLSFGIAFAKENENLKETFNKADEALYSVKNSGKNGHKFAE